MKCYAYIAAVLANIFVTVNCGCVCDTKSADDVCADDWSRTKYLFSGCKRVEYGIPLPCEKLPHICRTVALVQPVTEVQLPCGLVKCEAILALPDHFHTKNGCCQLRSLTEEPLELAKPSNAGLAAGLTLGIILTIIVGICVVSFSLKLKWTEYLCTKLRNLTQFHQRYPLIDSADRAVYKSGETELSHIQEKPDEIDAAVLKLTLREKEPPNVNRLL